MKAYIALEGSVIWLIKHRVTGIFEIFIKAMKCTILRSQHECYVLLANIFPIIIFKFYTQKNLGTREVLNTQRMWKENTKKHQ